jgi:colicin import membrane protein
MTLLRRLWTSIAILCLSCGLAALAQAEPTSTTLEAQRQAVQANFEREVQACRSRFVTTACIDEARARRQVADKPLREAQLQMEAQARQQRAIERRRVVADKQREAAERRATRASASASDAGFTPLAGPATDGDSAPPASMPPGPAPDLRVRRPAIEIPAEVAQRQREAQRRREQSEQAQARVSRRLQARQAQPRLATPLPVPGSPAAAAATASLAAAASAAASTPAR